MYNTQDRIRVGQGRPKCRTSRDQREENTEEKLEHKTEEQ